MPRQKSLITVIRDLVRQEIGHAISNLLGGTGGKAQKKKTGTRRRRRRKGRRGPGRPPGSRSRKRAAAGE